MEKMKEKKERNSSYRILRKNKSIGESVLSHYLFKNGDNSFFKTQDPTVPSPGNRANKPLIQLDKLKLVDNIENLSTKETGKKSPKNNYSSYKSRLSLKPSKELKFFTGIRKQITLNPRTDNKSKTKSISKRSMFSRNLQSPKEKSTQQPLKLYKKSKQGVN